MKVIIPIFVIVLTLSNLAHVASFSSELVWEFEDEECFISISPTSDGKAVVGSLFGTIYLIGKNGNIINKINVATPTISISPDEKYIIADMSGTLYVYDNELNKIWDYRLKGLNGISCISQNGKYIASGSTAKDVYLFDINGTQIWRKNTSGKVKSISVDKEGTNILTGLDDGNIILFDKFGNVKWSYEINTKVMYASMNQVNKVFVSPNGNFILAFYGKKLISGFNNSGNLLWNFPKEYPSGSDIESVSISQDGKYIVVGSADKNIYFLNNSGDILWKFFSENEIDSVSISQDGKYIAAGTLDKIYLFNKSGELIWNYEAEKEINHVSINKKYLGATHFGSFKYPEPKATDNGKSYLFEINDKLSTITKENQVNENSQTKEESAVIIPKEEIKETTEDTQQAQETKNTPGFELPTIAVGSLFAIYILNKRKK